MSKLLFNIDEGTKVKVYKTFGRTTQQVEDDVKIVKEWMQTQSHLPESMDEAKIRNFLILNKFNIEKTKQCADMYYTIRSTPGWFDESNPKILNCKPAAKHFLWGLHPKLADNLYRIHFFQLTTPGQFYPSDITLSLFNIYEMRLQEDCIVGDVIVFDYRNFNFEDFTRITFTEIAKCFAIYKKVYSLQIKVVYFINCPEAVSMVMRICRIVLSPKIFERFLVFKDAEILKEVFSEDVLPKEYGGQGPSVRELNESLNKLYPQYQNRFDKLDILRVDESLRPESSQKHLELKKTFKNLDVD